MYASYASPTSLSIHPTLCLTTQIVVALAFSFAFFGLGRAGYIAPVENEGGHIRSPDDTAFLPFWLVYGLNVHEASFTWVSAAVLFSYMLFANVALINLLVAMFSETYHRVNLDADTEFRFQKYRSVYLHRFVLCPIPPVLNLPLLLWWRLASAGWRGDLAPQGSSDLSDSFDLSRNTSISEEGTRNATRNKRRESFFPTSRALVGFLERRANQWRTSRVPPGVTHVAV